MSHSEQELDILVEICQILSDGPELSLVFQRAMTLLTDKLGIDKAALLMRDEKYEKMKIVAATGLTPEEKQRGIYAEDEGIIGRLMATGQGQIIPDIRADEDFLDRLGLATTTQDRQISFLCAPIKDADTVVGAISVHKPFLDSPSLDADARLLSIVAGLFAHTVRVHHLLQVENDRLLNENTQLRADLRSKYRFDNIIGESQAMVKVLAEIGQVAPSRATCLLLGETGVGKELIAKAIHYNSPRRDKPLIRVNCSALSPQLLESELFGHVQGAFTGAIRDKVGRFEAADGGTIFLDEVATLDTQMQAKLLRVLQEREFERVGDHHCIKVDVRVIAATNLDLEEQLRNKLFREDLYYRLNVVNIKLPPLRSRREDIEPLIDFFLAKYNAENNRSLRTISYEIRNTLLRYPWPGNVRELENTIERAVVLSLGEDFTENLLPPQIHRFAPQKRPHSGDTSIEMTAGKLASDAVKQSEMHKGKIYGHVVDQVEQQLIRQALKQTGKNLTNTAKFLGINRNTLREKIRKFGIESTD